MAQNNIIDFYISSLSGGGAEHVLINLAESFKKMGNIVTITSLERRKQFYEVDPGIEIFRYNHTNTNAVVSIFKDILSVRKQLKKRASTNVSVSFLGRTNIVLAIASIGLNRKIVVCDRNNLARKYPKIVFLFLCAIYSLADTLVVQTNEIIGVYPRFIRKKIKVLENPLDFEEMNNQCDGEDSPEKSNTIISVGRLEKQKDYKTLIEAFAKIADVHPEWTLRIYGKGNMRDEIQGWIDETGFSNRILLCGTTHKPFFEMKKSKIFVLSSFFEGFPNALCEAMYAGLPCIATACQSGPRDLIENEKNGFLIEVGDATEMSKKMSELIIDQSLRDAIGKEAHQRILRLNSNIVCKRWLQTILE